MANVIAGRPAAHPGHRPQQDPGGPALRRVQDALPRERRRVLRQLLRLLPARGLHPDDGHLHREGLLHQRGDRQDAPLGHALAPRAPRRDHRGQRLLHLRPRLARGLPRHAARQLEEGTEIAAGRRCCGGSSRSSTSATTSTSTAGPSACAATWWRSSRPTRRTGPSASSSSATRSSRSPRSTPAGQDTRAALDRRPSIPGSHYVTTAGRR